MRAAVYVLLLSGLLVALAEGYSVRREEYMPAPTVTMVKGRKYQKNDNDNQVYYFQENKRGRSEEDDKSFISHEDTKEGQLWASDEDPDWTPWDSLENDSTYDDYTYEQYSQENDDYTHEQYSQENDYTHEQYSQENDDYTDEQYSQEDRRPFPEVLVPGGLSGGELRLQDLGRPSTSRKYYQDTFKNKRDVKSGYQTGQVVHVPAAYENDPYRPGVSVGVEPLLPVEGPPHHKVSAGVEPAVKDKSSEESGESSARDWLRQGWRKFTGKVKETVGRIGDKVEHAGDKIHQKFHGLREKVAHLVEQFKSLLSKFGIFIQEGVRYCLRRFEHSYDQVRESAVIEKLKKKLEEGHAEVAQFFQILGEKIKLWRVQHTYENIDAGLVEGYTQEGQGQVGVPQRQDIEQQMPDFYQDRDVLAQLGKLEAQGVLTHNEIIILTQDQSHQN